MTNITEAVNNNINNVEDTLKQPDEQVNKSVMNVEQTAKDKDEQVRLSNNHNNQQATGIIVGSVILTLIGVTFGFSPTQNQLVMKSSASSQSLPSILQTTLERTSQRTLARNAVKMTIGWIFIGNINKALNSELAGKPLIKNSQSTDSIVVPSVGSVVTVNVEPGVMLRENRPQAPKFSSQEQKALAVLKPQEKLKILQLELIKSSSTTQSSTKVWAKVYRCGDACSVNSSRSIGEHSQ